MRLLGKALHFHHHRMKYRTHNVATLPSLCSSLVLILSLLLTCPRTSSFPMQPVRIRVEPASLAAEVISSTTDPIDSGKRPNPTMPIVLTTNPVSRRVVVGTLGVAASTFIASNAVAANRRQIELCFVAIQRVNFWAERQANALNNKTTNDAMRRTLYLESRLGAKAILTSRIGPGSTGTVYTLSTLRLPECLADLEWHAAETKSPSTVRTVSEARVRLTEALASIVEFDGLETLTDPSPRSTLTMAQYTDKKADYVVRAFRELVLPSSRQLLASFGPEPLERSRRYIEQYYSSEIPIKEDG